MPYLIRMFLQHFYNDLDWRAKLQTLGGLAPGLYTHHFNMYLKLIWMSQTSCVWKRGFSTQNSHSILVRLPARPGKEGIVKNKTVFCCSFKSQGFSVRQISVEGKSTVFQYCTLSMCGPCCCTLKVGGISACSPLPYQRDITLSRIQGLYFIDSNGNHHTFTMVAVRGATIITTKIVLLK